MIGTWLTIKGGTVSSMPLVEVEGTIEEGIQPVLSKFRNFKVLVHGRHFVLIGNNSKKPKRLLLTNN